MSKKLLTGVAAVAMTLGVLASTAGAAPLPDNCTRDQGTVTCTTFDGPGNNQGGVGTTTENESQGNTKNDSPEPQELQDSESCNPESSNGKPCHP